MSSRFNLNDSIYDENELHPVSPQHKQKEEGSQLTVNTDPQKMHPAFIHEHQN